MVEMDHRKTFFLPGIGGRLSLYQLGDGVARAGLTYDEAANPEAVDVVIAAMRGA